MSVELLVEVSVLSRLKPREPQPPKGLTPEDLESWRKYNVPARQPNRSEAYGVKITGKPSSPLTRTDAVELAEFIHEKTRHSFNAEPTGKEIKTLDTPEYFKTKVGSFANEKDSPEKKSKSPAFDTQIASVRTKILHQTQRDSVKPEPFKEHQVTKEFGTDLGKARAAAKQVRVLLHSLGYKVEVRGDERFGD